MKSFPNTNLHAPIRRASAFLVALFLLFACLPVSSFAADAQIVFSESFESDFVLRPAGWEGASTTTGRTTDYASDGAASIRLRDTETTKSVSVFSPKISMKSGVYYRVLVDVYNLSGNGTVFIQFFNASGTQTDSVSTTITATGKWETADFTVSLPEGASYMRILLYSGVANKGETCFDHVRVIEDPVDPEQTVYDFPVVTASHPRLFFTSEELSALRAATEGSVAGIAGYTGAAARAELLAAADQLLSQSSFEVTYYSSTAVSFQIPFVERHFSSAPTGYSGSNYPYWQEMANQMMEMMQTLSLAYALTGNTAYGERAVALAESLTGWGTWTEYPTINRTSLETGYLVIGVSTVCDLCHGLLDDARRATLSEAIVSKGLSPLFSDLSAFTDHNYYVNKASALALGSLLLLGENADAPKFLSRACDFFRWYLNDRAGSESQEGLSYTSYSLDLLFGALDSLRRVTGKEELLAHPYAGTAFRWAVMTGRNGDGAGPPISDTFSNAYFFVVANVMKDPDCAGLANWYLSTREPDDVSIFRKLVYFRPAEGLAKESPDEYTARTGQNLTNGVVDGIGWGSLRTGWGENDLLLVCVANNSTHGHSHYDQNSFVLALGNDWILSDPGYQDYGSTAGSDYTLSAGHSTVTVDGRTQSIKGGNSTLSGKMDSSAYAALIGNAAGAYAGMDVTQFERGFILIRSGETAYYVVADQLAAQSAHEWSWVLNAEGIRSAKYYSDGGYDPLNVSGASFRGSEFFAVGASGALRIAFDQAHRVSYDPFGGKGSLIRVGSDGASGQTSFCAVISPLSGKGVNSMTVEGSVAVAESFTSATQTGVRTSHGELSDLILVARAAGVSGGGLTSDGKTASLIGLSENGNYLGYAATACTSLTWQGRTLLSASSPVSASVFFDGNESVLTGPAGTVVRIFAPNGIGSLRPDASGYCTVTLTGERTLLSVNAGSSDAPAVEPAETTEPIQPKKKGCRGTVEPAFCGILVLAAAPFLRRRKRR